MQLIHINNDTIELGKVALDQYLTAVVSGPANGKTYGTGMRRETGPQALIGIICGCIEHGIDEEEDIVHAASRASRCRTSTVRRVLVELTGENPDRHLWQLRNGFYDNHSNGDNDDAYPRVLIAA